MHASALSLFLMECAALSLKNDDELGGGLASSLQKRHKIRNTDITKLYNVLDPMKASTYSKAYVVFNLLHYAGAAYSDAWSLIHAQANMLGDVQVKPHWDPNKNYSLDKIYDWEPMNLFPGWSLTNVRNNNHVFDPHVLFWQNGIASNDLHGVLQSNSSNQTEGMQMANHLHAKDFAMAQHRLGNGSMPNRGRSYSGYSSYFQENKGNEFHTLDKLQNNNTRSVDKQKALEKFNALLTRFRGGTQAGKDHYQEMLNSLQKQGLTIHDDPVKPLQNALKNWTQHREANIRVLENVINQLQGCDPNTFSMDIASNKMQLSN